MEVMPLATSLVPLSESAGEQRIEMVAMGPIAATPFFLQIEEKHLNRSRWQVYNTVFALDLKKDISFFPLHLPDFFKTNAV
jgi:hypothetical protein